MPKVQIETAITVEAKQAEKQIKDFNRAMSTIAGQKTVFINAKLEGADEIQKRLKESIEGLKGIKFDNKGVMTQILGIEDARKALRQLEGELGKTAGNARAAIQNKIGRVSAYIGAYNEAIDYRSNQIRSGRAVSSQRQLGKYYNEGRQVRIQQINENLAIARQNNDYREQLSLLKEKVKLLERIDKANRAKTPNPEIEETRKQIAAIQQKVQTNKAVEAQQRKQVDYEKMFGAEVKKTNGSHASQGGIMRNLVSIFRRYISLYTLLDVGRKMAETTGYFEQQQVALEGILGSASEAQKAIDRIKSLALESPFQTKDLVAYTKQLSAYGIENDKLVDTMKDLADISAGLGVDMGRLILAYGQVKSAAVLRGQELRQFTEAGIPMVQALADKFTELNGKLVTTGEVFKLISERKVPFEMVAEVLRDMTAEGGKFFNMQENLTETLYGQIQKLKDVWTLALNDTGSRMSGALMSVVKALQGVLKHISGILASGLMVAFIAGARAVYRNWGAFTNLLTKSKIELKLIKVEIQNAIIRTNQAAAGAAKWKTALLGVGRVAKQIGRALMSPVGLFAMTALVGIWVDAREKATQFRRELEEIDKSFDKGYKKQVEGLDAVIGKLSVAAHGSKAYNEAMSSLKQNYGDYVNDSLIEQLLKEQKELKNTGNSWTELRNSIVAAMEARNEYEKHVARAEKAGSEVESDAKDTHWYLGFQSAIENATAGAQMDFSYDKQKASRVNQAIEMAISDFFENGGLTLDDFKKYVEKEAKQYAPEYAKVLNAIAERYFNVFAKGEKWNKYVTETDKVKNDPYQLNKKAIEAAREAAADENEGKWKGTDEEYRAISQKNKDYDPFTWFKQEDEKYISAVKGRMTELYSAITDSMKGEEYKKAKADLETAFNSAWDTGKTKAIADAMKQFADSVNDPNLRANILNLMGLFVNAAGTKSGVAKQISTNIENDFMKGVNVSARQKDFFNRYNPTDQNVEALRNQIVSEYQRLEAENKSHPNPQGEWKKKVNENTEEMGWLKLLASSRYYDVDLSKKSGGGWRRMFSDLFGYIKEARAEEKKLVEHSAGLTTDLAKQINSKQLEGTAVNAFWSEGSPFKRFIDKMDEYGLESKIFSKDFLQGALSKIATKQIESTGTINYEDVWKQLIEVIKGRIDKLSLDPKMKSTVDTMKTYLQQMVLEGEKFFGRDKVEKLIEDQLKEMRKINGQFDKLRSEQKAIDSIRESSNALRAYQALGSRGYTSNAEVTRQQLQSLLSAGGGKGLSLATQLAQLINGGKLGIAGIGQILAVKQSLSGISTKDMKGDDEAARQANFKEFQGVLNQFDQLLGQLVNDIEEDFKRLMALKDPTMKASDDIINAVDEFRKALELIANGIENGDISKTESEAMSVQALQNLFGGISKGLGGNGMQDFINRLYKQEGTDIGVSSTGFGVGMWLNKGSLAEKYANMQAQMVASRKQDLDYELEKGDITQEQYDAELEKATKEAANATLDFASKMELTAAIIQKVDGYIQKGAQFANKLIDAMDANNGLTTDEYGNYTYENDYSEAKKAVNMIAEFSSGISGAIQSFMQGDIFGGIMGIGTSIAGFFENLFGIGDAKIQRQQDKLISSNKSLERALTNLEHVVNGVAGIDKWKNYTEQIEKLKQQEANNKKLEELEVSKKHGDKDKAESYRDAAEEAKRQIDDIIRGIQEEIFGTADELASQLTDALVEAFRNGENAARAWRNAVRSYIGDVLKEVLMTKVIAPQIDSLLDQFVGGATDPKEILRKFSDPAAAVGLRNALMSLSDEMIDGFNNLPQAIQEMIAWNQDTSELSGGIQGITEDTARTLEGLSNSMLAQLVLIQRSVLVLEGSGFAQVQTSWFNDMLNQQRALRQAADSINNILTASRDGVRYLHVQMH